MIDITEILMHWHAGRSLSEMAESLDADRKTLRKYSAPAAAAGIAPGGPAKKPAGMGSTSLARHLRHSALVHACVLSRAQAKASRCCQPGSARRSAG